MATAGEMRPVKMHLLINVTDLERSLTFYEAFFGTAPHKVRPGYANFDLNEPPLKFAMNEHPVERGAGALQSPGLSGPQRGRCHRRQGAAADSGAGHVRRDRYDLLLRPAGQALGCITRMATPGRSTSSPMICWMTTITTTRAISCKWPTRSAARLCLFRPDRTTAAWTSGGRWLIG